MPDDTCRASGMETVIHKLQSIGLKTVIPTICHEENCMRFASIFTFCAFHNFHESHKRRAAPIIPSSWKNHVGNSTDEAKMTMPEAIKNSTKAETSTRWIALYNPFLSFPNILATPDKMRGPGMMAAKRPIAKAESKRIIENNIKNYIFY